MTPADATWVHFPALGSNAVLAVTDPKALAPAERMLRSALRALDRAASRFRADSDLAAVNAAGGRPVPVSHVMVDAVETALRAARASGGLVDPTVGHALRVLGYDRDFAAMPADRAAAPVVVAAVPGWRLVWADAASRTVHVPAGVELDLGATAKARSADLAAAAIASRTGTGVLVGLGGDLAVCGPPPDGCRTMSNPPTVARPLVGGRSVVSIRTVVDLPAPLGPRKP